MSHITQDMCHTACSGCKQQQVQLLMSELSVKSARLCPACICQQQQEHMGMGMHMQYTFAMAHLH